jgi:hypothetical protein
MLTILLFLMIWRIGVKHIMMPMVNDAIEDRMRLIENIVIPYPKFNGVLSKINECHEKSVILKVPPSLLITGEVGSGKTYIFERYLKQNYKEWEEEVDDGIRFKKNILAVTLTHAVTHGELIVQLLSHLGAIKPEHGRNNAERLTRLVQLIKETGIEIIMIDEFHNIIDRDKKKTLFKVSETFKDIINLTGVAFVFFGLDDPRNPELNSTVILENSIQLKKRVPDHVKLERFKFDTGKQQENFKRLLFEFDQLLPFEKLSGLSESNISSKIFQATDGLIYSIKQLIEAAAWVAMKKHENCIELEHFAKAFAQNKFINEDYKGYAKTNPFID